MEKPKIQHLILLIGSNPLPNAVAGKILVEPEGTITLVHSSDSFPVAQRLKAWLEKEHKKKGMVKLKQVEESEPSSIYKNVQECIKEAGTESVGLNYTGGTKMMSVHAYRAVEQWAKDKGITPVFTYLDARTLEMIIDPVDDYSSERRIYVGRAVELKLEDLLELHGLSLSHKPTSTALLPKTARALAKICSSSDGFRRWKEWINTELQNRSDRLSMPEDESLKNVYRTLCREVGQPEGEIALKQLAFKNTHQSFSEWLSGKWLEHYVIDVLNELQERLHLHERAQNIVPREVIFDVDVVAIRGYQLFAFSCKVISDEKKNGKKELKKALFEAYVRAQQLGGDEARTALVCCAEVPAGIEQEMQRDFDLRGRVRVFGRKHLAELASYIEDWILSQSGEEG